MHRPRRNRVGVALFADVERDRVEYPTSDDLLDARDLVVAHRSVMREIKAQTIGSNERPSLMHVIAQHLSQRGVQQVRRRVIALGVESLVARHNRMRSAEADFSFCFADGGHASVDFSYFLNVNLPAIAFDYAGVGDLSS